MPKPSNLGAQIEATLETSVDYATHSVGHSDYLLRYRTTTGIPFAIGRTSGSSVRFWVSADDRFKAAIEVEGFVCTRSAPKAMKNGSRATGRNSNLDQIPEFKNRPLYWTSVKSPSEVLRVASKLR